MIMMMIKSIQNILLSLSV